MEKLPKNYDASVLGRILDNLNKEIAALGSLRLKQIKSIAQDAASNLAINELGYVLDNSQNLDLAFRASDSRLYRITGMASTSGGGSGSGGTTDHGSLSGLGDDDHTQYHNDTRGDVRYPLKSLLTTKGDLFVRDASTVNKLGIGSDGQVLTADSTQATGAKWAAPAAGYTDEQAQDAVGSILTDTASIDFTYNDGANTISAAVLPAGVDHGGLGGLLDDDHTQYVLRSILTTKGDLFVRDASAVNRLGVGTDGHIFIADSAQATGVKWAAPSAVSLITDTESRMFSMMVGIH